MLFYSELICFYFKLIMNTIRITQNIQLPNLMGIIMGIMGVMK